MILKNSQVQPQKCGTIQQMAVFPFFILFFQFVQDEDLKWVEDNIPSSLTDV